MTAQEAINTIRAIVNVQYTITETSCPADGPPVSRTVSHVTPFCAVERVWLEDLIPLLTKLV